MEKSRKPKIRFKGYNDDWEQRKLSGILCEKNERTSDFNSFPLYSLTIENGITPKTNRYERSSLVTKTEDLFKIVNQNEFVTNPMNLRFGALGYNKNPHYISVSGYYDVFSIDNDKCSAFWNSYFKTISVMTVFDNAATGSLIEKRRVKYSTLKQISLLMPIELREKQKIGSFFEDIDELITLHQRKLEKLMNVKKSMLEKMFPKQGSVVPEIRFCGFTDAWEQRKFRELYSKSGEKNDGSIGINKNITVATMQFKGDVKVSTPEYLKTYYTFNLGDIAFEGHQSKEFRYGRFVENDIGNGIVSHIFSVFRPVKEYDLHFWKYAINNEELMQHILSRSTKASTMMHDLVTDDFLNETFLVPSLSEQEKVGSILHNLDNLITLHQRKLEKLKNIKKSMLEKMFI